MRPPVARVALESEIRLQDVRVLESRELIEKQRSLVADLEARGRNATFARKILVKLLELHRLRSANLKSLRLELEHSE